ncbi:hypothetical protein HYALB_00013866 [Hymenoscyphus albidus]|uniref:Uncharacterized protein n=1 Tax=Hymenoscyphus albidus TaxID=595503 RepID=A0A9N9LY51_9HELO|nr:hypothetical protein HYALB_00013866 [Hymenoscyphus albidus]
MHLPASSSPLSTREREIFMDSVLCICYARGVRATHSDLLDTKRFGSYEMARIGKLSAMAPDHSLRRFDELGIDKKTIVEIRTIHFGDVRFRLGCSTAALVGDVSSCTCLALCPKAKEKVARLGNCIASDVFHAVLDSIEEARGSDDQHSNSDQYSERKLIDVHCHERSDNSIPKNDVGRIDDRHLWGGNRDIVDFVTWKSVAAIQSLRGYLRRRFFPYSVNGILTTHGRIQDRG